MEYSTVASVSALNNMRPTVHRHPHLWGHRFLNLPSTTQDTKIEMEQEVEKLKEEVGKKLLNMKVADDPKTIIFYVNEIERLGVAYHFEEEIEAIIVQFYHNYITQNHSTNDIDDLHYISLQFRILRQHGFYVSCDIFEKFKGENGIFKESLAREVNGILNLYEASYLRVHGEKILDEAMEFTKSQLKLLVDKLSKPKATQVRQALMIPLHRNHPRLVSRYYIDTYEANPSHDKTLLRFAKLNFNSVQLLHLKELQDLSRWWKSHEFSTKLPFARDRIVETYVWAMASYEPRFALLRALTTKFCNMGLTITDDIFDSYGLLDELKLYAEAVERWDKKCINQLPDYMKLAYEKLLEAFDECEQELAKEGRSHIVSYVRELLKRTCRGYLQEAIWANNEGYIPMYDEYMEGAAIATGAHDFLSAVAFMGMGNLSTEQLFEWVSHNPKPVNAASIIGRLLNDIAGHKKLSPLMAAVKIDGEKEVIAVDQEQILGDNLWISTSDHPGLAITARQFNGENYNAWHKSAKMSLGAKLKLGLVDGTCVRPTEGPALISKWIRADYMVRCWLINSLTPEIADCFTFANSAKELWDELAERFGEPNGPLIYQLHRELSLLCQNNESVAVYFSKLKRYWDQIASIDGIPVCSCGKINPCTCEIPKKMQELQDRQKLFQFLMGLNSGYEATRNQILSMDPLPSINKAYYMIQQIEKQRQVSDTMGASAHTEAEIALVQSGSSKFNSSSTTIKKESFKDSKKAKNDKYCNHCKFKGHSTEQCFKLHGYPEWYKLMFGNKITAATSSVQDEAGADEPPEPPRKSESRGDSDQRNMIKSVCQEMIKCFKEQSSTNPTTGPYF